MSKTSDGFVVDAAYYRMTAVVYWENAKMLQEAFERKGQKVRGNRMAVPYYLLISHAMELLLKCALLKRQTSPKDLKKFELRHNLKSLLDAVEALHIPITARTREIVHVMSSQHSNHVFRYTVFFEEGGPVFVPEPVDLNGVLEELLMAGRISTHGV